MRFTSYLNFIISGLVVVLMCGYVLAAEPKYDVSEILAVIPVKDGIVGKSVYKKFDRLVPQLKKVSKNKIVKLECRYSGQPDREQDVEKAYELAANIEKYLRIHHALDLDLWVTVAMVPKSPKTSPVLTIGVFSDDIKKLDAVLINPPPNNSK